MVKEDFEEVAKHINILNVAYQLSLEIVETNGYEVKCICPFCGYNKNSKIATLTLNSNTNKYYCSRCKVNGFSIGLYAKVRCINSKEAYKELLEKEYFSMNKSHITISPINEISNIDTRDIIYRTFLNMLNLEAKHRKYLKDNGFLDSTIDNQLYRTIPNKYIKRRLIANSLSKQYDLAGIPGFYQEEDLGWTFANAKGLFVPLFDDNNKIQALSMHLDEPYNNNTDIWFSSNGKINGTGTRNWVSKNNINENTNTILLTDNLILGNLIKDILNVPIIIFSSITNSYQVLNALDNTNIKNIIFVTRESENTILDYIIHRIYKDLIPLGYNLERKYVKDYTDILQDNFLDLFTLKKLVNQN